MNYLSLRSIENILTLIKCYLLCSYMNSEISHTLFNVFAHFQQQQRYKQAVKVSPLFLKGLQCAQRITSSK